MKPKKIFFKKKLLENKTTIFQAETKDSPQRFVFLFWFCFGLGSKFDLLLFEGCQFEEKD